MIETSDDPASGNEREAIPAPGQPAARSRAPARLLDGLTAAAVGAYAFLDDLFVGPIVIGLAAWLPWYVTLGAAAAVLTAVNLACCRWLQHRWDLFIHGRGAKLEARIEKMQTGRLMKYPARWMSRDSLVLFTIAAGLIGAVIIVAAARVVGGEPVSRRRVRSGSVAYAVGFAATYSGIGVGIGDLARAL